MTVEIDGTSVTVRELDVEDVIFLFESEGGIQTLAAAAVGNPKGIRVLLELATDLTADEIKVGCAGVNTYARLATALREVNADFFETLPRQLKGLAALGEGPDFTTPSAD